MLNPYVHNELVSLSWQSFFAGSTRAGRVTIFEKITCTWTDRTHRRYDFNLISYKFLVDAHKIALRFEPFGPQEGSQDH